MKTLWGAFFILTMGLIFLSIISSVLEEAGDKNDRLDNETKLLILNLTSVSKEYDPSYLEPVSNSETENSTFEGVDAFARQYFEDKQEVREDASQSEKILNMPDVLLNSIGIQNNALLTTIKLFIISLITFALGLGAYKAARTGETG
jgi:hypothetical protein